MAKSSTRRRDSPCYVVAITTVPHRTACCGSAPCCRRLACLQGGGRRITRVRAAATSGRDTRRLASP